VKFMLMLTEDDRLQERPVRETERILEQHRRVGQELRAQGKWVSGTRLRPAAEAATIRRTNDRWVVTDGPFAETKEAIGGCYVIECDSTEEAIEWAKKLPVFEYGAVEVRRVWETP
jgi:hypothetical protein